MKRSTFIKNGILIIGAVTISSGKLFAVAKHGGDYKITMITERVGVFTEKGGAILFVYTKEGTVIVDAQFPDSAGHLIEEVRKKNGEPFRLLINTHHHADHTAGNVAFKDLMPHVLAHENSKKNQAASAEKQNTTDKQLLPDQTYITTWCEKAGNEDVCLYHYGPAHTNGDSVVHFADANVVHLGDLVFNRRHPFVDRSTGASISNWIKVLETTVEKFSKKTTYICGHSADGYEVIITREDVLSFRDYLGNLLKYTAAELSAGKTKTDILKAQSIPGSPQWTGNGIEKPLEAAYAELTAE